MSVTGTWNLTLNSPLGDQAASSTCRMRAVSCRARSPARATRAAAAGLGRGRHVVSFAADADTPVGRLNLAFSGTVIGDSLSGKYETPFGAFDFSGTRA